MYVCAPGATIHHHFREYALFSVPKTCGRTGFIKFVQLSGLFRNALAYFNGTGYKRNLLLFFNELLYYFPNIKIKHMNSAVDLRNMLHNFGNIRDFSFPPCA